ncbi:hypothetical protein HA402_000477 [Bradysia odoriphaga]|nr:hypothetical protein HA402_000477 [Bradysia odoriphaga]
MTTLAVIIVLVLAAAYVDSHGSITTPLARTRIQDLPNWGGAQQPFWWDSQGVWCANVPQDVNVSTCGRCGDAPGQTHANRGGRYDKGIITGTYNAGQQIDMVIQFAANHRGGYWIELCTLNNGESDTCFTRLTVVRADREIRPGNMVCSGNDQQNGPTNLRVQLPAGFRCTRCTLRWTYRTSYPPAPDACFNPNPAQTFRNCADIRIN